MEVSKCQKIAEFLKILILVKIKNFKTFRSPKQWSAWRKVFSTPPNKSFIRLWSKNFQMDIYRNIQTFAFQVLRDAVLGRLERVQCKCFFWHQTETCFWLCCEGIFFIMLSVLKFVKWVRFFVRNSIVKWIFFASFCWLWDFLPENLKLVNKLHFLVQILFFGTVLEHFSSCNFKIFCRRLPTVANIFTSLHPLHHHHKNIFSGPMWSCTLKVI